MSEAHDSPYRPIWWLFIGIVVVTLGVAISKNIATGDDKVPWRHELPAALEEAKRDNKPVFLYFTASWCGPCQKLKSDTWADVNVANYLGGHYVPVKIDVDADSDTARAYRVEAMPTFLVINSKDGKIVKQSVGFMPADEFIGWIGNATQLIEGARRMTAMLRRNVTDSISRSKTVSSRCSEACFSDKS